VIGSRIGAEPGDRPAVGWRATVSAGRPVVVVGAGIAGLVVAHRLAAQGVPVVVVDGAPAPGGRIATRRRHGLVLEAGPDGLVAGPAVLALCRELGLERQLVEPLPPAATSILWRGELHPLPIGTVLGVPVELRAVWRTKLLRPREKARALLDLVLPGAGDGLDPDGPLGPALRRRLGDAIVERLVEPLLGGLHGGSLDDLAGGAVAPWLVEVLRRGSVVRGLGRLRRAQPMPLRSLRDGMGRLVEALVGRLDGRVEWVLGRRVEAVAPQAEGWRLTLADGSSLVAAGLVLACPARAAGQLLGPVDRELGALLSGIAHRSLAVVNLAYREADLGRPAEGHGVLVPRTEPGRLRGVSWASRKWPGRAPAGVLLARAFLDLAGDDEQGPDVLTAEAAAVLEPIVRPRRPPFLAEVHTFVGTMPRYTVGHLARLAAIEARRRRLPGLFLVGSAYRGAGIGELVRAGEAVALEVAAGLDARAAPAAGAGARSAASSR
jgi:oxygen-dependent protoporphyrinogen oxidase